MSINYWEYEFNKKDNKEGNRLLDVYFVVCCTKFEKAGWFGKGLKKWENTECPYII